MMSPRRRPISCTLIAAYSMLLQAYRLMVVCIMSIFTLGSPENFVRQAKYSFDQRRRISNLDYGHFDPPEIQAIKLALHLRYPDLPNFSLDIPLPHLTLPDLLALLPDLPHLPDIDWPSLQLMFPEIDFPDLPSFRLPFDWPEISNPFSCTFWCESFSEIIEEVLGTLADLLLGMRCCTLLLLCKPSP